MKVLHWLLLAVMLTAGVVAAEQPAAPPAADEPELAPFPNLTLYPLDNSSQVNLESFRGRPVLLTFWASWCSPCRVELPEFEKLYNELAGKGLMLVTVNVDQDKRAARRFLEMTGLTVPVYRLSQAELLAVGVRSLPTSVLLKPSGIPAEVFQGYSPTVANYIRELVVEMLEEAQPAQTQPTQTQPAQASPEQ